MTIDEMFNELEDKARDIFIVTLKYKYDFEENYTIENQILDYNSIDDSYVWLNDWYEGQTDIEVLGYMLLGDVNTTKLLTCEDCITMSDLVSRQNIINIINSLPNANPSYSRTCDVVDRADLLYLVERAESIDPEQKDGTWTMDYKGRMKQCSECGVRFDTWSQELLYDSFCPNCGTRMKNDDIVLEEEKNETNN